MTYKDFPIKRKLTILIVVVSGLVLLFTSAAFMAYEWYTARNSLISSVTTLTQVIADNSSAALAFSNREDAQEVLSALKAEKRITGAVIYDNQSKVFAWYPPDLPSIKIPEKFPSEGYVFEDAHLLVHEPITERNRTYGKLYVEASMSEVYKRLIFHGEITILFLLLSLLGAFLLSKEFQTVISDPITSLAKAAEQVSEKNDYKVRVKKEGTDEIGVLTDTFNQMLEKIEETDAGLRKALKEKDILIQEVHHRVKNNLQVILSLFDMQTRKVENPDVLEIFQDSKSRVRSMSLVHEMLLESGDVSKIDFYSYTKNLVNNLAKSYPGGAQITTEVDLSHLELDIHQAVPLGLLFNEILTNSFKHAFNPGEAGKIFIKEAPENRLTLIVGDNGRGLPDFIDLINAKTLGLNIIRLLAEQLNAQLTVSKTAGTAYIIELPKNPTRLSP